MSSEPIALSTCKRAVLVEKPDNQNNTNTQNQENINPRKKSKQIQEKPILPIESSEKMNPSKTQQKINQLKTETQINFHKLSENAYTPTLGSNQSAGYDLYAAYDLEIPVGHRKLVKTDLQISLPENTYGRIAPRSGLAYKFGIDVMAGVIDRDYRGNVGVLLVNLDFMNNESFVVKKGDRIAQLVIEKCYLDTNLVEFHESLEETERGQGGFGSTGKR